MEWNCGNGIAEFHSTFHNSKSSFYPLFRQCHCHNCQKFIPSISAMPLPQTIFFFLPFSAMALPQLPIFFSPTFGFPCVHSHFEHPPGQQVWAEGIAAIPLLKIKNFSLLLFIFLSPTFVEFRQWYCRNSLSFLRLLYKLKQYI